MGNPKEFFKEVYCNEKNNLSVSIKVLGRTQVEINVSRHFTGYQIIHFLVLLVFTYFLCSNLIYFMFSFNVSISFLFTITVSYCFYRIYTELFSPWKQSIMFVNNIGLQVTTVNSLSKESSEYISYGEIENFAIVEMFHQQFSVVTYLTCLLKNKEKHKIIFGDFGLKLADQEVMYQCMKHVLVDTKPVVKEHS